MIDPLAHARDEALDDEAALDRALRITKLFYLTADPSAAKYAAELAKLLIAVKQRARARHQAAERERLSILHGDEIAAQLL